MGEGEREREREERNDGVSTILSNEKVEEQTSEDNPIQIVAHRSNYKRAILSNSDDHFPVEIHCLARAYCSPTIDHAEQ